MERDEEMYYKTYFPLISTHTLTWSVTAEQAVNDLNQNISTHTLTWSVTIGSVNGGKDYIDFNSHAHVERDSVIVIRSPCKSKISTHTLTWSVTPQLYPLKPLQEISTHTLTWSVTLSGFKSLTYFTFQLTRSRGA